MAQGNVVFTPEDHLILESYKTVVETDTSLYFTVWKIWTALLSRLSTDTTPEGRRELR